MAFLIYREVLEDRMSLLLEKAGVDFYTEWETVKGKGHNTVPHLGSRTYPGFNNVRMIAFENESQLEDVICRLDELNREIRIADDKVRLFQVPLERIV